ncbi:MAG: TraB/GumN family protein, partial [Desulfobulbaceae bacterium]|nr:TraB/GumN family protein [Desulfobulbaceae bacterium]
PLLALNLVTSQLMKMGYYPEFGIDMYFSKKANTRIPIYELETMEEQASMVFDLSNGEAFLKYTLLDLSTMETDFQDMVDAWKSGDSQKMEELIFGPYQNDPVLVALFQRIFYLRNKSMVIKIKDLLQTDKKLFIVVGAGHLVGEKGIVQLLKDTGVSVKQL